MPSIYDYPAIYDVIMRTSTDQISVEIDAIDLLLRERDISNARILEIASGTSPHGIPLSQQGHTVTGIDLSQPMITYVQQMDTQNAYIHADLRNFTLQTAPFDCAIFMSETFPLITEYDDLVNHFNAVHRHLKKGGFYLIDIDTQRSGYRHSTKTWGHQTVVLPNGHVAFWYEDHPADWIRGINRLTMHTNIQTQTFKTATADHWDIRIYNPWTLSVFIKSLNNWQLHGFYSYCDQSQNIENDDNYYMLLSAQ
jgi:SAM-dependent methyltransferase